mgnify:CR=1 FL=1
MFNTHIYNLYQNRPAYEDLRLLQRILHMSFPLNYKVRKDIHLSVEQDANPTLLPIPFRNADGSLRTKTDGGILFIHGTTGYTIESKTPFVFSIDRPERQHTTTSEGSGPYTVDLTAMTCECLSYRLPMSAKETQRMGLSERETLCKKVGCKHLLWAAMVTGAIDFGPLIARHCPWCDAELAEDAQTLEWAIRIRKGERLK